MLGRCAHQGGRPVGTVRGTVLSGPRCPVVVAGSPCPDRPWIGEVSASTLDGEVVSSVQTGATGPSCWPGAGRLPAHGAGDRSRSRVLPTVEVRWPTNGLRDPPSGHRHPVRDRPRVCAPPDRRRGRADARSLSPRPGATIAERAAARDVACAPEVPRHLRVHPEEHVLSQQPETPLKRAARTPTIWIVLGTLVFLLVVSFVGREPAGERFTLTEFRTALQRGAHRQRGHPRRRPDRQGRARRRRHLHAPRTRPTSPTSSRPSSRRRAWPPRSIHRSRTRCSAR